MASLNNVTTTDGYSDANTVVTPNAQGFTLLVSNAAIYLRRSVPTGGGARGYTSWQPEQYYPPGYYNPPNSPCEAVAVRSAVSGTPAQVTVHGH